MNDDTTHVLAFHDDPARGYMRVPLDAVPTMTALGDSGEGDSMGG